MSPTIALKYRMNRAMKQEAAARLSKRTAAYRTVSIGSEFDQSVPTSPQIVSNRDLEEDAALLLLSVSKLVKDEIKDDTSFFDITSSEEEYNLNTSRSMDLDSVIRSRINTESPSSDQECFAWNRLRSVSIDSPTQGQSPLLSSSRPSHNMSLISAMSYPNIVSPSPGGHKGRPIRKASLRLCQKVKREQLKLPKFAPPTMCVKEHKKKAFQASVAKGTPIKKILRKKFSWKNYPGTYSLITSTLLPTSLNRIVLTLPYLSIHYYRTRSLPHCQP